VPEIASNPEVLRKRLRRLLGNSRQKDPMEISRIVLPLLQDVGSLGLIGGAVRDVARFGVDKFKSDLDFVLYDGNLPRFRSLMDKLNGKPNRFGGYALRFERLRVDIWALEDTWARTAGLRPVHNLRDLLDCTFFDWDAIIFDVKSGKIIFKPGYFSSLESRILDINLEENPNPTGSLVRALRRGALWGVGFGPRLTSFAKRQLDRECWENLVDIDSRAFGRPILRYHDPKKVRRGLDCEFEFGDRRLSQPFGSPENQLELHLTENKCF
jgi:hypothetical protein